jgi:hypothetical protein
MRWLATVLLVTAAATAWGADQDPASPTGDERPARATETAVDLADLRPEVRREGTLSEDRVRAVAHATLERCGLPPDTVHATAPWYFHYELGLRLAEAGDPQRAVDALLDAAERKPLPVERARMYGMWFIDYRPYLELAAGHAALGNWQCAFSALELSRATGEVDAGAGDEPAVRYLELLEETLVHVGAD